MYEGVAEQKKTPRATATAMDRIDINVINLPQASDRRKAFEHLNKVTGLQFAFVDGVESQCLDFDTLKKENLVEEGTRFRNPGCSLAHRRLWLKCKGSGRPIVICEDDAVLRKDFGPQLKKCMETLPADWTFLLLGWNLDQEITAELIPSIESFNARFTNRKLGQVDLQQFQNSQMPIGVVPLLNAFGTPGYAISPAGAALLLDNVFPLRNCQVTFHFYQRTAAAETMDAILSGLYKRMRAYACFPPLLITPNEQSPNSRYYLIS